VNQDVRAELTAAGSARLSAILLGVPESGSMVPRLQFGSGDTAAVVYLEAYGPARCSAVAASLELVASEDGPVLIQAPASVSQTERSDGCILYGGFEIGTLKPGDYLVRAGVSVDGKPAGRVTRTLRKTAVAAQQPADARGVLQIE
jgi:hypothetical protein